MQVNEDWNADGVYMMTLWLKTTGLHLFVHSAQVNLMLKRWTEW